MLQTGPKSRFDYVSFDEHSAKRQAEAKSSVQIVESFIEMYSASRAKAMALSKLEECYMWIGKMIRDSQIEAQEQIIAECEAKERRLDTLADAAALQKLEEKLTDTNVAEAEASLAQAEDAIKSLDDKIEETKEMVADAIKDTEEVLAQVSPSPAEEPKETP